ncbi:uncharacterized protein N7525_005497 [Penicillium rubens]|uniref:uncharacterized protein n=1 Tax=Penicillium rubens TaxID=1108849 RepID=UPI002A5ACDA0|nr:uncharacterized protein N7525_005497 [Penicillium rubens]KAJ5840309.1 hypothetical protein N7525_005497 [Penicillium rubens]
MVGGNRILASYESSAKPALLCLTTCNTKSPNLVVRERKEDLINLRSRIRYKNIPLGSHLDTRTSVSKNSAKTASGCGYGLIRVVSTLSTKLRITGKCSLALNRYTLLKERKLLDRIFSVTIDNATNNETLIRAL